MLPLIRRFVGHPLFDELVLGVILVNALAMGIEATPELAELYEGPLSAIFLISQVFFVLEIAARLLSYWPRPADFFRDGWNLFDFVLVALSLIPAVGSFTVAARLLRALRVLRVVSTRASLRDFVGGERRGWAALPALLVLSLVVGYVFALFGFHLFGPSQPESWGSLGAALRSLGRLATLRDFGGFAGLGWLFAGAFYAGLGTLLVALGRALFGRRGVAS
ncbi:MAG: ion transporter [Thermoanaerobaculia bacterium]|nr:ion transporter [Thermoanaerobaculia bacterium]